MNLNNLGWQNDFQSAFEALNNSNLIPGRVACEHPGIYTVYSESGDLEAKPSGRMKHLATSRAHLPAVGDWVAMHPRPDEHTATIHAVLPRQSAVSRQGSGAEPDEQIIAANIDTVFVVSALDGEFHPRRIERYLTMIWDSGANPVVILNKADLCNDVEKPLSELNAVAPGIPAHVITAETGWAIDSLDPYIGSGQTVATAGSSGVGKSTLINSLLGEKRLRVAAVRERDGLGRHTTTHRELILLPTGGLIVDTPGMRTLHMWGDEDSLSSGFQDIENLFGQCQFRDCKHQREPGCAIQAALQSGHLDQGRWENYLSLQRELARTERKKKHKARIQERQGRQKFQKSSRRKDKMQINRHFDDE